MDKLLSEKWRGYDGTVRDKLYEVRSANEKKDFKKAIELAEKMRKEMKLTAGNRGVAQAAGGLGAQVGSGEGR